MDIDRPNLVKKMQKYEKPSSALIEDFKLEFTTPEVPRRIQEIEENVEALKEEIE